MALAGYIIVSDNSFYRFIFMNVWTLHSYIYLPFHRPGAPFQTYWIDSNNLQLTNALVLRLFYHLNQFRTDPVERLLTIVVMEDTWGVWHQSLLLSNAATKSRSSNWWASINCMRAQRSRAPISRKMRALEWISTRNSLVVVNLGQSFCLCKATRADDRAVSGLENVYGPDFD